MIPKFGHSIIFTAFFALVLAGCEPRVHIETPEKPIEINLNLKIDHEVRVKLDKEIDTLISENPDLF
ncbi:MAG: YnbE family lipoprotein [Pseudomonadota bacterium]